MSHLSVVLVKYCRIKVFGHLFSETSYGTPAQRHGEQVKSSGAENNFKVMVNGVKKKENGQLTKNDTAMHGQQKKFTI